MAARKMRLVPDDLIDMIKRRDIQQSSPELDATVRLDKQMESILADKHLTLEEKVQKYNDTLSSYITFRKQAQALNPLNQISANIPVHAEELPNVAGVTHDQIDSIVGTFAKSYQQKARKLLETLQSSGVAGWDVENELILDGNNVVGSNIIDLVYDTVARKQTRNPTGSIQFNNLLNKLHVPRLLRANIQSLEVDRPVAVKKMKPSKTDERDDEGMRSADDFWDAS
jgi:hypothetical protein